MYHNQLVSPRKMSSYVRVCVCVRMFLSAYFTGNELFHFKSALLQRKRYTKEILPRCLKQFQLLDVC